MFALPRARAVTLLVIAFLALQLAVPALGLLGPRPARFGWHMYSALPSLPEVSVLNSDGSEESVDLAELFVVQRAEIDYAGAVRERLCGVSDVREVLIQHADAVERIPC